MNRPGQYFILIVFIGIFGLQVAPAQENQIAVETIIDTTVATIGDRVHLRINLRFPPGTVFELPQIEKSLGKFEVFGNRLSEPRKQDRMLEQDWELTLAVFDTGQATIPALEIKARKPEDSTAVLSFKTVPQTVQVYSVLAPDSRELKDIKPPFRLRRYISGQTILLIALVGLLAGAYWYYRRWKKAHPPVFIDEKFLDPPHVVALNQLNALKEALETTPEGVRLFYFRISEILREFLERRFFIRALEMTTSEIAEAFNYVEVEKSAAAEWNALLPELDIVKYAGQIPALRDILTVWEKACRCVELTKHESFLWRTM